MSAKLDRLIQRPARPPSKAQPDAAAPARASTACSGVPSGISTTPGRGTAPATVTSVVPGSAAVPTAANQSDPNRATNARWASVSALSTRVGRPGITGVQEPHQGGRFGGDIPFGYRDHLDLERCACSFGQRRPQGVGGCGKFRYGEDDPVRADGIGRSQGAVDDQVRCDG